jgi:glycosyltransferase involved in cell wall biosynthesis
MQVGVVARFAPPDTRATGEAVDRTVRVARRLAAAGHEITVYCTRWWDAETGRHEHDGLSYRAVTDLPERTLFRLRLAGRLAADRPDTVHAVGPPWVVRAAGTGARLGGAPLVVDWYGEETLEGVTDRPERVVTPSELVRTAARERGVSEDRTAVVPDGVDLDLVRSTEPEGGADVIAGRRLDAASNLGSLFLALAELRDRGWSATVVGDGPERERYEREVADLRIDDRVEFPGELSREERIARYRGARVFVHTATREAFATELCWALACGCAGVVEYQAGSAAHELVERRDRGFRVTTPEEVEDAIVAAGALEHMTVDGSMAEYDHDTLTERWLAVYRAAGADDRPG